MRHIILSLAFLVLGLGSRARATEAKEPVSVLLFSAPWCEDCRHELPEVQRLFDTQLASKVGRYRVTAYIETGATPSSHPTLEAAVHFKQSLGVKFDFLPDPWKWQTFRKYLTTLAIPAAVVLDAEGHVLRRFEGDTFTASELVDYLATVVH